MAIGNKSSGRTATSLRSCRSLGSRCASHYCGSRLPSHSAGLGSRRSQFDVQAGLGSKGSNVVAFCAPARRGSAIAPRSSLSIPRSCERAGS